MNNWIILSCACDPNIVCNKTSIVPYKSQLTAYLSLERGCAGSWLQVTTTYPFNIQHYNIQYWLEISRDIPTHTIRSSISSLIQCEQRTVLGMWIVNGYKTAYKNQATMKAMNAFYLPHCPTKITRITTFIDSSNKRIAPPNVWPLVSM